MARDVAENTKLVARNFNYRTSGDVVLEGGSVLAQISDPSKIAAEVHNDWNSYALPTPSHAIPRSHTPP